MQIVQREFYRSAVDQHRKTKTFGAWSLTAAQNAWSCAMNGRRAAIVGWTSSILTNSWRRKVRRKRR